MRRRLFRRWFLPKSPDVLGLLGRQGEATMRALRAYEAWAHGDEERVEELEAAEHEARACRRELLDAVKVAFVTPVSPEDLYELSERLDSVLQGARDLVRESDVLAMEPDAPMADMAALVREGAAHACAAFPLLVSDADGATGRADAAVQTTRHLEQRYRTAMSALLSESELRVVVGRRELYRRSVGMGDALNRVAHRIWYAVVKEQ